MSRSLYSVDITEQDRQRFPDLFRTKKQLNKYSKSEIASSVRNKLRSLKKSYLEEKIRKEKELIMEREKFEELLEKYQRFRKPDDDLPSPIFRHFGIKSTIIFQLFKLII